mmetsp:Transcript_15468/g.21619  ORF Transcript_15468/g.21619 Transcript_15468/m.21619 type:complete len:227 (-) Transcript_15468:526-1206(-)
MSLHLNQSRGLLHQTQVIWAGSRQRGGHVRMIELEEAVLGHQQDILGRGLLLHGLLVLLVLLLPHIRGLGDRLVQRGHAGLQGLDLLHGGLCSLLLGGDGLLQSLDLVAECLGLALVLEGLLVAVVLLVVVIGLLLHHQRGHVVDHLHDRREVDSLVGQGQHNQVDVGSVGNRLGAHALGIGLQCIQRFAPGLGTLQLQKAWARQCLLEEPEVLIAVQDLDGLLNG